MINNFSQQNNNISWTFMSSLTEYNSWTIWKERNARIFNHKSAPTTALLNIIKTEVKLWVAAGAKCLSFVTTGE
jgi:hypothetical protein